MKTNQKFLNLLFSGLLGMTFNLAAAQNGGAEKNSDIDAEFEFGVYLLDDESFRFGKYTGVTDDSEPLFNFHVSSTPAWDSDDPTSWSVQGWRVGLDSMRLAFDYDQQGTQEFSVGYRSIPNNRFSDGMSPFLGIGTDYLQTPDDWVGPPNGGTDSFETLDENLKPVRSRWVRDRLDLGYERYIKRNWKFSVDWRNETKDGLRTFGGVIGNSGGNPRAAVMLAPIDWETDIMEARFDFGNSRYQFGFSVYASWFDNGQNSVTWDNPYGRRSGWATGVGFPDGQGLYSLEPDNEALQFRLYGGVNLSQSSRLSADISFGSMEQDDMLFAYSVNPALEVDVPLPRTSLDAEIETTHANIRYTVRPFDRLNVLASYTLDDRDNKTPRDEWIYIGGDSQDQKDPEEARINLPYSYEKQSWDVSATWRAARGVRLRGGFEHDEYSRSYSEVLDSDETGYSAGLNLNRWENVSLSLDFSSSERDIDEYTGNRPLILSHLPGAIGDDDFENLPALRKYNQTDRERDELRVRADIFAHPKFNFAVAGSRFEDDYNDSAGLFGLQKSEVTSWSVDFGFYPTDGFRLTAYYTEETYDSEQSSRTWSSSSAAEDPDRNWFADSEDDVETWNIALTFTGPGGKSGGSGIAEFGMDYTYSNVESNIVVTGAEDVTTAPLPQLVSEMTSISLFANFEISENSAIRVSFELQELDTTDFALDGVPVDGPSNVLLLGNSAPNYDLTLLMLSYNYRY